MSVFTQLTDDEIRQLLTHFDAGELNACAGIHQGVENSNYDVRTTRGRFVLTVIEWRSFHGARFCLEVMERLARRRVPVPQPRRARGGALLARFDDKPVALVDFLPGQDRSDVSATDCTLVGETLGRLHREAEDISPRGRNPRGATWRKRTAQRIRHLLSPADAELLDQALKLAGRFDHMALPRGVIHADLFRDNVLFEGDKLTGVLDFFYTCEGILAYDLAIAAIDWCDGTSGRIDPALLQALLEGYQHVRLLSDMERRIFSSHALPAAALRFWLSRLHDRHYPRPGADVQVKDPNEFLRLLRTLVDASPP